MGMGTKIQSIEHYRTTSMIAIAIVMAALLLGYDISKTIDRLVDRLIERKKQENQK